MDPSHLQELVELEDNYWWHVAKRQLVTRLLLKHCPPPGRLVEGGIGSGRAQLSLMIATSSLEMSRQNRSLQRSSNHLPLGGINVAPNLTVVFAVLAIW